MEDTLEPLDLTFPPPMPTEKPDDDDPLAPYWDEVLRTIDVLQVDENKARFIVALEHGLTTGDCVAE